MNPTHSPHFPKITRLNLLTFQNFTPQSRHLARKNLLNLLTFQNVDTPYDYVDSFGYFDSRVLLNSQTQLRTLKLFGKLGTLNYYEFLL